MQRFGSFGVGAALLCALAGFEQLGEVRAAGGPAPENGGPYRVLAPIESGNLLLFPVVRGDSKSPGAAPFITLDEGFKSGEVEVTEASRAAGLIRSRGNGPANQFRSDQVNTLVLVNHSKRPLLLLAGEIVTGGKQDRIIAKDRVVPSDADPIDLSVFCIEPGRWTGSTASFGAAANAPAKSFMVQPEVRKQAMAGQDQQQVWNAVHGAISTMESVAAAPPMAGTASAGNPAPRTLGTTSYARAMQSAAVSQKVDEASEPAINGREQVLAKLRDEHAVGVVVAVRGEIIWADLFASTDLLSRYWTKLVRSYAAESLAGNDDHPAPSVTDAQRFLDAPASGSETSEGDVGIYRYRDLKSDRTETFILESLLPGTGYDVHISKMKLRGVEHRVTKPLEQMPPQIYR
jgi:hypothetical protein